MDNLLIIVVIVGLPLLNTLRVLWLVVWDTLLPEWLREAGVMTQAEVIDVYPVYYGRH